MLKARYDVPPDWGDSPDGRYYLYSGMANYTMPYWHTESWCRSKYNSVLGANFQGSLGFSGRESIEWDGNGHARMHNCTHIKERELSYTFFLAWVDNAYYKRLAWYQRYRYPLTSVTYYQNRHLTDDIMLASSRAWWNMQPRFEGEISLLNFIFELKDFRDLAKYALRPKFSPLYKMFKKRKFPVVNDPTKPAAEATLLWNFALKPLWADLTAIHAQMCTIAYEAQKDFADRGLEYQKSHYSETLATDHSLAAPSPKYWYWTSGKYHATKFTATLEYKYRYTNRPAVEAFRRYWGLNMNYEALWNAIPFSFVVDYFSSVGKAIHAMEVDRNSAVTWRQYCESLVTTLNSGGFLVPDSRSGGIIVNGQWLDVISDYVLVAGISSKVYHRYRAMPNKGVALPRLREPSGTQLANLVALARCMF